METFAEKLRKDRRLVLLRLLSEQNGYRANNSILHAGLNFVGVVASKDDVLTDLHWLCDQGLVRLHATGVSDVVVADLSNRGNEVVQGQAIVPGVSRPSPK